VDARSVRSREALRQALLALIGEKPFALLSVREIAAKAGVTFPTFYRQFSTKEELLSDIATAEVRQLLAKMVAHLDQRDPYVSSMAVCSHVEDRRQLWKILLTTGATSAMREEFLKISREIVAERGQINPGVPAELISGVLVSGIFETLSWWLRQPDDYPAARVARFMAAYVLKPSMTPGQTHLTHHADESQHP
jgi:AcrR family transcriptional regulator